MQLVAQAKAVPKVEREAPVRGLVAELLGELPVTRRPVAGARALQAALVWGDDHLVDLVEVEEGRPLVIGKGPGAVLQVAHEATFAGSFEVARLGIDGLRVTAPVLANARLFGPSSERGAVELLDSGAAKTVRVPVEGVQFVLADDERAVLRFGNLRLVLRIVRPSKRARWIDADFVTRVSLYLLVGLTLAGGLHRTDWTPDALVDDSRFALGVLP